MSPIQKPLEIVHLDPSDTAGEQFDARHIALSNGSEAGFLIDSRHLGYEIGNQHEAYTATDVVSRMISSAARTYDRKVIAGKPITISDEHTGDHGYHRDSKAPSRTASMRIHYGASGDREITFGNELPERYLDYAYNLGLDESYTPPPAVEQTGVEHAGMFAVFPVTGAVLGKESLLVPGKHLFATIPSPVPIRWGRTDVDILPSRMKK